MVGGSNDSSGAAFTGTTEAQEGAVPGREREAPEERAVFDARLSGKTAQITDEDEKRKYITQQWGSVEV